MRTYFSVKTPRVARDLIVALDKRFLVGVKSKENEERIRPVSFSVRIPRRYLRD